MKRVSLLLSKIRLLLACAAKILILICVLHFFQRAVYGFDYDSYKPFTMNSVVLAHPRDDDTPPEIDFESLECGRLLKIRVKAIYSGEFRPLSKIHKRVLSMWCKSTRKDQVFELFKQEVKLKEGKNIYWVPIQEALVPDLKKEAKPSQESTFYIVYIGQFNDDHVFLINEFAIETRYEKIIKEYTRFILSEPNNEGFYFNRGIVYLKNHQYDEAIKDFTKVISLNGDFGKAYFCRGTAYFEKSFFDKAIRDYEKAIRLEPSITNLYYNCGNAYYEKGIHSKDEKCIKTAIRYLTKAIKLKNNDWQAYGCRGAAHYELQEYDQALRDFEKAVKINPEVISKFKKYMDKCKSK
ncbi:hypothetical protein ES707_06561 [subsurface metagenome]